MKTRLLFSFLLIILASGCVSSLHPLYSSDTLVFRNEMLGTWVQSDGEGQWIFKKEDPLGDSYSYYTLNYTEKEVNSHKESQSNYNVHLVKLNNYYFLDFELLLSDEEQEKLLGNFFSPVLVTHKFAKIDIASGKLKLYLFDDDWLTDLFEKQKIRMKHEKMEDTSILLTASTAELQKFVTKYADDEQAFSDELVLIRKAL